MSVEIKAPAMGESIAEATVAKWMKNSGDYVAADEIVAELETDKVNLEVTAPVAGKLTEIKAEVGATVSPDDIMAVLDDNAAAPAASAKKSASDPEPKAEPENASEQKFTDESSSEKLTETPAAMPAAAKLMREHDINAQHVAGTGKDGRVLKEDVLKHLAGVTEKTDGKTEETSRAAEGAAVAAVASAPQGTQATETREPMSRMRQTIASRLKTAQNTAAMLTTYNEIDLHEVKQLRAAHKDSFQQQYGVKLGFMSFFTKAVANALQDQPLLNARIDGDEIVHQQNIHIGIAVASPRGLVVPVLRHANQMNFAEIESAIADYGQKARDGKLMPDDMTGGTFSITNGGTFGSMLSMPILNYPQVGILGMHNIQDRPHVVNGEIKIRPIMYVALTYDHRLIDGQEAVTFLRHIKEQLEDPGRMLLGL